MPRIIRDVTGQVSCDVMAMRSLELTNESAQSYVPFGDAVVSTDDTVIGVELCEELFTPAS